MPVEAGIAAVAAAGEFQDGGEAGGGHGEEDHVGAGGFAETTGAGDELAIGQLDEVRAAEGQAGGGVGPVAIRGLGRADHAFAVATLTGDEGEGGAVFEEAQRGFSGLAGHVHEGGELPHGAVRAGVGFQRPLLLGSRAAGAGVDVEAGAVEAFVRRIDGGAPEPVAFGQELLQRGPDLAVHGGGVACLAAQRGGVAAAEQVEPLFIRRDDELGIAQIQAGLVDGDVVHPDLAIGGDEGVDGALAFGGGVRLTEAAVEEVLEARDVGGAVVRGLVPDFFHGNQLRRGGLRVQQAGAGKGQKGGGRKGQKA